MSDSIEGQPGDVRSPSYCLLYLSDPVPYITVGSPRISEINLDTVHQIVCPTLFHVFSTFSFTPQHRKLLWRSLLAHRPAFHSLPRFPHRVSRCATIYLKHCAHLYPVGCRLPYSVLVRASRALRRNITRQNTRGSRPPCSQMVHQYTQGPIHLT